MSATCLVQSITDRAERVSCHSPAGGTAGISFFRQRAQKDDEKGKNNAYFDHAGHAIRLTTTIYPFVGNKLSCAIFLIWRNTVEAEGKRADSEFCAVVRR